MTLVLLYVFSLVVSFLLGFLLCYAMAKPPEVGPVISGSSHSDVTHMTVSDMTLEEFVMSDED